MSADSIDPAEISQGNAKSWRYRCPNGHTSWHPRTQIGGIYCSTCQQGYDTILDAKTGTEVTA